VFFIISQKAGTINMCHGTWPKVLSHNTATMAIKIQQEFWKGHFKPCHGIKHTPLLFACIWELLEANLLTIPRPPPGLWVEWELLSSLGARGCGLHTFWSSLVYLPVAGATVCSRSHQSFSSNSSSVVQEPQEAAILRCKGQHFL
jgi:hypothetical protein